MVCAAFLSRFLIFLRRDLFLFFSFLTSRLKASNRAWGSWGSEEADEDDELSESLSELLSELEDEDGGDGGSEPPSLAKLPFGEAEAGGCPAGGTLLFVVEVEFDDAGLSESEAEITFLCLGTFDVELVPELVVEFAGGLGAANSSGGRCWADAVKVDCRNLMRAERRVAMVYLAMPAELADRESNVLWGGGVEVRWYLE